ncbi:molybdate ABC transporter substrate-binding protein [Dongia sedimenti]|uniref:Molybdate ABC transporter substrate-binding protein n=1 Tax=Dongia sedimenti TaxID=3064282 RepID=A0ABU0YN70_9PROT|nr:molybdate ABC transporter substrate-binding protein [Rhodospirillaceae bacterium R-7]
MRRFFAIVLSLALLLGAAAAAHAAEVTVLAAASLTDALGQIDADYEKATGNKVKAAFGGSSALAKQLEKGAPADLFISADVPWMDYVAKANLIDPGSRANLLGNHLVLVGPASSTETVTIDQSFDLAGALKGGKLSVADTSAVPAGKYAKASLEKLGQWPKVEGSLAQAENVRAALALVERGEAPLGIVYQTDALVAKVKVIGTFPDDSHPPIVYPVALTVQGAQSDAAKAYLEYLKSDAAKAVFEQAGFVILK